MSVQSHGTHRMRDVPRNAFTISELLVVIAIIAALAGVLVPTVKAVRQMAQRTTAINGARQLNLAINAYTVDWRGFLPGPMNGGNSVHYYKGNFQVGVFVYSYFDEPAPAAGVDSGMLHALRDRAREAAGYKTEFVRVLRYFPQGPKVGAYFDPCGYPGNGSLPRRLSSIGRPAENIFFQDSCLGNYSTGVNIPAMPFYGRYITAYYDSHVEMTARSYGDIYY